jgi:hypothetical protein
VKRILLLVTVASMLAAVMALSGVAQAAPISGKADAKCLKLTIKTLGPGYHPSNYTFIGGTEGNDNFDTLATADPQVFCGFGGEDYRSTLDGNEVFLGGTGNDLVGGFNNGTFYGQDGNDDVTDNEGTFYGGAGDDTVGQDNGGIFVD